MFYSCTNLKYLTLPNQMRSLRDASDMFRSCSSLKYIDLGFLENNSNIKNLEGMFINCNNLMEIEFPNVYTKPYLNLRYMFSGCINIKSINLGKIKGKQIGSMTQMFFNCEKLEFIDISGLNLTDVGGNEKFKIFEGVGKNTTKNITIKYDKDNIDEDIEIQIEELINKTSL